MGSRHSFSTFPLQEEAEGKRTAGKNPPFVSNTQFGSDVSRPSPGRFPRRCQISSPVNIVRLRRGCVSFCRSATVGSDWRFERLIRSPLQLL